MDLLRFPKLCKQLFIMYLAWYERLMLQTIVISPKAFYALLNVVFRFCNSLLYYGLGLNAGSLAGSIYVTVFLGKKSCIKLILLEFSVTSGNFHSYSGGAVEIPAVLVSIWAMFYFGRRPTLAWGFIAAAAFNFLCIPFINNSGQSPPQCNKS